MWKIFSDYNKMQLEMDLKMVWGLPWVSLVAQLVKNPPAVRETPVQFLGLEDTMEKG